MTHLRLAFLGFGNVLQALAGLLMDKTATLQAEYGVEISVVGIATRSRGIAIDPDGLDLKRALAIDHLSRLHTFQPVADMLDFIRLCPADMVMEGIVVNPQTGQPATDYCRAALQAGKHVVTANKGPVAFAQRELSALAGAQGLGFFYESTVLDGAPLHSLRREGLLAADVLEIRGILNSTTNSILTRMEQGMSFEAALQEMQAAGTAEANPSNDIDGWDSAIKIAILANTFMGADLRPAEVERIGIRDVTTAQIAQARQNGGRVKLICKALRREDGIITAQVAPEVIPLADPLAGLEGASSGISLYTDQIERLSLVKSPSSPRSTAYGMLVDMLNLWRGRR